VAAPGDRRWLVLVVVASALGGAAVSFLMLVAARALQGAFGAVLAPSALGTLVSTFRDPRERGRAFGVFGSVAAGGGRWTGPGRYWPAPGCS
jgi:MFS family permease